MPLITGILLKLALILEWSENRHSQFSLSGFVQGIEGVLYEAESSEQRFHTD
jgi:hypothetical protein